MKNELLEKWAEAIGPWFEREKEWLGTPFFAPPAEALKAVLEASTAPDDFLVPFRARQELVTEYAWAIPTDEALEAIARQAPGGVVEIGAGTGYWAKLLRDHGVDVVAYDRRPYNNSQARREWGLVEHGGPLSVLKHPDRTLMLCWPPYDTNMAAMALRCYKGDALVYIGEWRGATADDDFHELLENGWEEIEHVSLPQWPGIRDGLYVYRRAPEGVVRLPE